MVDQHGRKTRSNERQQSATSVPIDEDQGEVRSLEESMNRNNRKRVSSCDIRSLRPWTIAEEIKEVEVERREEEKRQNWQKGQNHAHSGSLSLSLNPLLVHRSVLHSCRIECAVTYRTERHSATTECAFDFSACTVHVCRGA